MTEKVNLIIKEKMEMTYIDDMLLHQSLDYWKGFFSKQT